MEAKSEIETVAEAETARQRHTQTYVATDRLGSSRGSRVHVRSNAGRQTDGQI